MTRLFSILMLVIATALLFACGGGKGAILPDPGDRGGNQDPVPEQPDDGSDLEIVFVARTPEVGPSPLKVDFLAVVRGGVQPYTFMWDFTNDGAPDIIQNNQKVTTATTSYTYPFLEVDGVNGLNQSTFSAVFTVIDSRMGSGNKPNYAVRTSLPVQVVVTNGSSFRFDPAKSGVTNSELGSETLSFTNGSQTMDLEFAVFKENTEIKFAANAVDGTPPYNYRWNLDYASVVPDTSGNFFATEFESKVDTTTQNPRYTFSFNRRPEMEALTINPGESIEDYTRRKEANYRLIHVEAVDSLGNKIQRIFGVKVVPENYTPPPPSPTFKVFIATEPPSIIANPNDATDKANSPVLVQLDRNNVDFSGTMIFPTVHFSAFVSTTPGEAGAPPYSYSWDFEGDGYIDSQAVSPTIPYFNENTRNLSNPYAWPGFYICKLRVRDAIGRVVSIEIGVNVIDITGQVPGNRLEIDPLAMVALGGGTGEIKEQSFAAPGDLVTFYVDITGGTAPYRIAWDRNNNGIFGNTLLDLDPDPNTNDPDPADAPQLTLSAEEAALGKLDKRELTKFELGAVQNGYYFGGVRVTDSSPVPVTVTAYSPVTVADVSTPISPNNPLIERSLHGAGVLNGNVYLVGGFLGNVALKTVERISVADNSFGIESSLFSNSTLTDMPTARGALAVGNIGPSVIAIGGIENVNGYSDKVESMSIAGTGNAVWVNRPGIGYRSGTSKNLAYHGMQFATLPNYLSFGGTPAPADGFIVCGGIVESGSVSPTTWFYLPIEGFPDPKPTDPNNDYWFVLRNMPTPRYNFAMARIGSWVYTIGGITADGSISKAVEALNLDTLVWVTLPNYPVQIAGAVAVGHDAQNFLAVYGGHTAISSTGEYTLASKSYAFSPVTNLWTEAQQISPQRTNFAGSLVDYQFLAEGGEAAAQNEGDQVTVVKIAPSPIP
ncbi:MAG: hypothetical protein HRF49_00615 [bacterium]|jgi:hypothetical protein